MRLFPICQGQFSLHKWMVACLMVGVVPMTNAAVSLASKPQASYQQNLQQGWEFRIAPQQAAAHAEIADWRPAQVPGHVHTDLLANGLIADPYVGMNEASLQWIGLAQWEYQLRFKLDAKTKAHQHQALVFDGLDTFADVYLNGEKLLSTDNAFRRYRIDVDGKLKATDNVLQVILHSPIERLLPQVQAMSHKLAGNYPSPYGDEPKDAMTANFVRKPGYHYGWDWGPRYVTAGIWRGVRLEAFDQTRILDWQVQQNLVNKDVVDATVEIHLNNAPSLDKNRATYLVVKAFDPDGRLVKEHAQNIDLQAGEQHITAPIQLDHPRLWFPNGYGEAARYRIEIALRAGKQVLLSETKQLGFRTIELRREKDQWGQSFAFVINGIPVFAKGANVIPFDMFPNRVTTATQRKILQSAKDANMNMLRLWGGGYYESDAFYDLADEMGLMIWQDFMFGGGVVPAYDKNFRDNVMIEASEQVQRLRHHPSIVLWCGNNEEETAWKDWGIGKDLIKANPEFADKVWQGYVQMFGKDLRQIVAQHGGGVPYWSSSPSNDLSDKANDSNNGDKHFWEVWAGSKPVEDYLLETPRFMSEFGLQAWPDLKTIDAFSKKEEQKIDGDVIRQHQKFLAGAGNDRLLHYIRANYGEPKNFEDFVYLGQVMQADGIGLAIKHHRSSMPRTMGSMYWQLNDVWPGASWSSIDYYGRWKALHFEARRAFSPLAVVAENIDGMTTIKAVSDKMQKQIAQLHVRVMDFYGNIKSDQSTDVEIAANTATQLAQYSNVDLLAGNEPSKSFVLIELRQNDKVVAQDLNFFAAPKLLALPQADIKLQWKKQRDHFALTLSSNALARAVWLDLGDIDAEFSDNAFNLLPDQTRVIQVRTKANLQQLQRALRVRHLIVRD